MRRQTALPRISREGWVPAGPEKRVNKCAMLIPKTGHPSDHLPTLMDFSETICPPERRALREIVETAEVVREGDHLYLLPCSTRATWMAPRRGGGYCGLSRSYRGRSLNRAKWFTDSPTGLDTRLGCGLP